MLVLHGGASRGDQVDGQPDAAVGAADDPRRAPDRARRPGRLAVFRLLNSHRGWDATTTPVMDVAWALDQVGGRGLGDLPVALVGHSLGGRAALLAADGPRGCARAVALNPWVYPTDDADLSGRVGARRARHRRPDRLAVERRRPWPAGCRRGPRWGYVAVPGAKHAMLRHGSDLRALRRRVRDRDPRWARRAHLAG